MKSLKQVNELLDSQVGTGLRLYKGAGYFYFDSEIGYVPDSIMVTSIRDVPLYCIEDAIAAFKAAILSESVDKADPKPLRLFRHN